jgi:hypothetical protein
VSWQLHFTLPWEALRRDAIRAAAKHVLTCGLGVTRYEIDDAGPDHVSVFFYFPAAAERRWEPWCAERNFRAYEIADDDEASVHFQFERILPGHEHDLPPETYFEFYSNISGNKIFAGMGVEIATCLGDYFGVECRPD